MQSITTRLMLTCAALGLLLAAACNRSDNGTAIIPKGSRPAYGPTMSNEMLTIIEALDSFHQAPLELLSPQQARTQKTIFDAAEVVRAQYGITPPSYTPDATDQTVTLNGAQISLRIYRPHNPGGPFPCILYYHGGGWVIATNQTYDASSRAIAEKTGAVVISVEYRKGPEAKFPAAHKDAFAAYKWALANATFLNINTAKMAVAGESAGGNLACNVSIMARDSGVVMPRHQLLIYPVAQNDTTTASYIQYAQAQPLNRSLVNYFLRNYLVTPSQSADPRISLINANLSNLPPTTIINAEIDPLRDDGYMLENKLKAAGVSVDRRLYDGVTHEFFGIETLLPQARDAQSVSTTALRQALQ